MVVTTLLWALALAASDDESWRRLGAQDGVTIYARERDGLAESLAIGVIDAPPRVVKRALDDYTGETGSMPFIGEVRVLRREPDGALVYNRVVSPLIGDRDYTLRIRDEIFVGAGGDVVIVSRFATANDEGPSPRAGVQRIETEGSWRLEAIDGGRRTRATYRVAAAPERGVPRWLDDWGTRFLLGGVFDAVRARVRDPRLQDLEDRP